MRRVMKEQEEGWCEKSVEGTGGWRVREEC